MNNPYGKSEKPTTAQVLAEKRKAYESLSQDFLPVEKLASVEPPRNPFAGLRVPGKN